MIITLLSSSGSAWIMFCMANSMAPVIRFCILLLFGAALLGLIGHQLSLVPYTEVSTAGAFSCTSNNRSGQETSPDAVGCPVHTGYLATTIATTRLSPPLPQDEVHSDSAKPLLLAFPVLHPPA